MVGRMLGPQAFPRASLKDLKQFQPQLRPRSSGSQSTPSRVQPDLRAPLEKLKYVPGMDLSFSVTGQKSQHPGSGIV